MSHGKCNKCNKTVYLQEGFKVHHPYFPKIFDFTKIINCLRLVLQEKRWHSIKCASNVPMKVDLIKHFFEICQTFNPFEIKDVLGN